MIRGTTTLIAHIGYPTEAFKVPMIYNPYFEANGIDAVMMPMGVKAEDYATVLPSIFKLTNIRGALITMPYELTTVGMVDELTPTLIRDDHGAHRSVALDAGVGALTEWRGR